MLLNGILGNFLSFKLKSITFALVGFFQWIMKFCKWWNQQLEEVLLVHARMKFQHTWVPVVREHLKTPESSLLFSLPSPTAN